MYVYILGSEFFYQNNYCLPPKYPVEYTHGYWLDTHETLYTSDHFSDIFYLTMTQAALSRAVSIGGMSWQQNSGVHWDFTMKNMETWQMNLTLFIIIYLYLYMNVASTPSKRFKNAKQSNTSETCLSRQQNLLLHLLVPYKCRTSIPLQIGDHPPMNR